MSMTQNAKLLAALETGRKMTPLEIWRELGIARASARVFDLRNAGHDIVSREVVVRNADGSQSRVAEYSLGSVQTTLLPNHPGRGVMSHV